MKRIIKKRWTRFAVLALAVGMILPQIPAHAVVPTDNPIIKVGVVYGASALADANLENSVGTGYRFGYYDENLNFQQQGYTGETKITMQPDLSTGSGAISVVATGTTDILYRFDGVGTANFAVKPGADDLIETATWFKGFRYYGSFQYLLSGGKLTVINVVPLEDYVKGVISAEMGGAWPLEALKAQAVSVRGFTLTQMAGKHAGNGFDVCNTTHCQVYYGLNKASATSDHAVDDTSGVYAWYNGKLAETYYFSSDGGATEDVGNVWRDDLDLPYLKGVIDPHEATISANIRDYNWTVNFTRQQLTERLSSKGYLNSGIVNLQITETTPMGNVKSIVFTDSSGKSWTMSKESARTILGLRSLRYTINGASNGAGGTPGTSTGETTPVYINGNGDTISALDGAYAIDGSGNLSPISGKPYGVTKDGAAQISPSSTGTTTAGTGSAVTAGGDSFTITGTGYGHSIGMSQYGANAMAKAGYSFDQILKFYYTGIDVR